ncbi:hypothetical protein BD408DRAFT_482354 [Parasitella parasitica]|nr:hypothetical protein BD408DRAFT_482354 [Parasitella parasitica]
MPSSDIQPPHCHCVNTEQLVASCKPVAQTHNVNLQDKFSLEDAAWKSRRRRQAEPTKLLDLGTSSADTGVKFYVDTSDTDQDSEEKEMEEEDSYSATWSYSSFEEEDELSSQIEQELDFVKEMDNHNNPIYTTAAATVKKPISLLTQMLNTSTSPQTPRQTEKKPLLRRCQSKYQNLSSWFGTCS